MRLLAALILATTRSAPVAARAGDARDRSLQFHRGVSRHAVTLPTASGTTTLPDQLGGTTFGLPAGVGLQF